MQSASDTPSSHSRRAVAKADRPSGGSSCRSRGPERGEPGRKQVIAKERVRPAAGVPGRIHERHATLRDLGGHRHLAQTVGLLEGPGEGVLDLQRRSFLDGSRWWIMVPGDHPYGPEDTLECRMSSLMR
jgi:hypothetical protein